MGYSFLLSAHSWFRWAVLISGVIAVVLSFRGASGNRAWTQTDRKAQLAYITSLDLQFLLGILLYLVSPLIRGGLADFGGSMKVGAVRFFLMEHLVLMVAALVVAHIFSARSKKAISDAGRQKTWRTGALLSLLLVLASIPWPFLSFGRPLFRM